MHMYIGFLTIKTCTAMPAELARLRHVRATVRMCAIPGILRNDRTNEHESDRRKLTNIRRGSVSQGGSDDGTECARSGTAGRIGAADWN